MANQPLNPERSKTECRATTLDMCSLRLVVEEPREPSQPVPELQLAPALPCVPKIMVAKKLHLQISLLMLSQTGQLNKHAAGYMLKKNEGPISGFRARAGSPGWGRGDLKESARSSLLPRQRSRFFHFTYYLGSLRSTSQCQVT